MQTGVFQFNVRLSPIVPTFVSPLPLRLGRLPSTKSPSTRQVKTEDKLKNVIDSSQRLLNTSSRCRISLNIPALLIQLLAKIMHADRTHVLQIAARDWMNRMDNPLGATFHLRKLQLRVGVNPDCALGVVGRGLYKLFCAVSAPCRDDIFKISMFKMRCLGRVNLLCAAICRSGRRIGCCIV